MGGPTVCPSCVGGKKKVDGVWEETRYLYRGLGA